MATPRIPNQRKQYNKLNERLARYVLAVQSIYDDLNKQAAKIGLQSGYDGEGEFRWSDFPELRSKVEKLQTNFVTDIGALIMRGTSEEWKNSNLLQDMIADKVIKTYTGEKNRKKFTHYYQTNSPQLRAFQQRKDRGMNLSTKLWNQSEEYKRTLEDVLAVSIERGTDAITLSKRISKYLSDFDTFKNDYTEKFGKATKVYDCEYRSIRLARSEINMAYRTAEQERWKQFDFVVGYEIKLSGSHPKEDICDSLAGKYPKNFVWTGWHPNDLCYCIPLLKTEDEFFATDDDNPSVNEVTDVPPQFKEWCTENWGRIAKAEKNKTLPYFLSDNKEYYKKELSIQKAADLRHRTRDADVIQLAWDNRKKLDSMEWYRSGGERDYSDYLNMIRQSEYFSIDTTELTAYLKGGITPEGFEEILLRYRQKVDVEYEAIYQYKKQAMQMLQDLQSKGVIFQLPSMQQKIQAYIDEHPLVKRWYTPTVGAVMPNKRDYERFVTHAKMEIEKQTRLLSKENQKAVEQALLTSKMHPMPIKKADAEHPNPNFSQGYEWQSNCQSCVVAYELRRRGYHVTSMARGTGLTDELSRNTAMIWLDPKTGLTPVPERLHIGMDESISEFVQRMASGMKKGGRYNISIFRPRGEGHIFTIECKRNGTIVVYDPQTGNIFDNATVEDTHNILYAFLKQHDRSTAVRILRVDDKLIDACNIDKIVHKYIS